MIISRPLDLLQAAGAEVCARMDSDDERARIAEESARAAAEALEAARAAARWVIIRAGAPICYENAPTKRDAELTPRATMAVEVEEYRPDDPKGWTFRHDGKMRFVWAEDARPYDVPQKPAEAPRTPDTEPPAVVAQDAQEPTAEAITAPQETPQESRAEWYRRKRSAVIRAAICAGLSAKQMGVLVTLTDPSTPEQWPIAWLPREELSELTGISQRSVTTAIEGLLEHGLIERADGGRGRTVQRYRIKIEL